MSSTRDDTNGRDSEVGNARRRARLAAGTAGLALVPWFWLVDPVAGFQLDSPPPGAPALEFVVFHVANVSRLP
jgi:hypothetical protein